MIRLSDMTAYVAFFRRLLPKYSFFLFIILFPLKITIIIISTLYRNHWTYIQILLFAFQTYFASFIILRVHYQKYSFTRSLRQIIHIQVWWYCFKSVGIIQLRYTPSASIHFYYCFDTTWILYFFWNSTNSSSLRL